MQNTLFPLNVSEVECINLAGRAKRVIDTNVKMQVSRGLGGYLN